MMTFPFLIVWAMFVLSPVTLSLSSQAAGRGQEVRALALVPRDAGNRSLCFWLERDRLRDYVSCEELQGAASAGTYWRWWNTARRPLPSGEYLAAAALTRIVDGRVRVYTDTQPLRVLGPE